MLTEVSFVEAGFWRYFFCVLGFLPFALSDRKAIKNLKNAFPGILIVGILGLFAFNLLLFLGLKYTSTINASLIISLSPVTTVLLSALVFKTEIRWQQIIGAAIGFSGIIVLLTKGNLLQFFSIKPNLGDGLVFLAMLLASSYHIWVQKFSAKLPLLPFTFLSNLVCFVAFSLSIIPFWFNELHLSSSPSFWLAATIFGFVGTTLTYLFWNKGVMKTGAGKAGLFMNLVPISTALIALVVGEPLHIYHGSSAILILGGLYVATKSKRRLGLNPQK